MSDKDPHLAAHEDICTERYGNLWDAIKDLKSTVQKNDTDMKSALETRESVTHARFNTISNRMWAVMCAVCGGAILGLGGTVFYLLTRGHT